MRRGIAPLVALLWAAMPLGSADAQTAEQTLTFPERPGEDQFVVDEAGLLAPADREAIEATCRELRADQKVPLLVVTVRSMAEHGVERADVARYAQALFDDWGIGWARWSYGVLVLVSVEDRKARIEMGRDWEHRWDARAERVMNGYMIPAFKNGHYAKGLRAGVMALDSMLRNQPPPRPAAAGGGVGDDTGSSGNGGVILLVIGVLLLGGWTVVSAVRHGVNGWAWQFWRVVFQVLFIVLRVALIAAVSSGSRSSSWSSSSSSSSFGGGSFGGGSSGGGGATGSW